MNVRTIIIYQIVTLLVQTVLCKYDKRVITTLKYSKYSLTPAVVNGKPAKEGQFPFLVSIKEPLHTLEPFKVVWVNLCGGSIITRTKVLSAAHCFEIDNFYFKKHPEALRVVAGNMKTDLIHNGLTETTANGQWRTVRKAILHQAFNFPANDIAIAIVDKPWVYTKNVRAVRLASRMTDYNGQCLSAGYGRLGFKDEDKVSKIMLTAEIDIVPSWRCTMMWEMNMNAYICSSSAVTDVAMGDSGGPLLCKFTGDPNEENDVGILVGVVSGKNFDKTTLYTRVSAYRAWIATDGLSFNIATSRSSTADHKLHVYLKVCLFIILFVLIYLLFSCLVPVPSRTTWNTFFRYGF